MDTDSFNSTIKYLYCLPPHCRLCSLKFASGDVVDAGNSKRITWIVLRNG